jgi:hypothetical protein
MFRAIYGALKLSTGGAAVTEVRLVREDVGLTPETVYLPDVTQLAANQDGEVIPGSGYAGPTEEVGGVARPVLWASEESDTQALYQVQVRRADLIRHWRTIATIAVPSGSTPITLQELLELGVPSTDPAFQTILSWLLGRWRGGWDAEALYERGEEVQHAGSTWAALQDSQGEEPPASPSGTSQFWALRAAGADLSKLRTTVLNGGDADPELPAGFGYFDFFGWVQP